MSYLVLARKYRPRVFADMVGQEAVSDVLRRAIRDDRVGHAYLFAGPRGTGKTTTARIFAKALNCERGPTPDPCGECERCRACDAGTELDVVEIDAASNNGVEHVRSLREQVGYAPAAARFKVYIVDEVHMMSKAAFNALLKTLEEPPPHVVFLFATTEVHRVPDTILSRCQVLRLAPIRAEHIEHRLDQVFAAEGIEAEAGVTAEVAARARGGMRDALSLADQLLALSGTSPTLADLGRVGGGGPAALLDLLDALAGGERATALERVAAAAGREGELAEGLVGALRNAVVAHYCGADSPLVEGDGRAYAALAERLGPARLEWWLADLLRARDRMERAPGLEGAVLESTLLELARTDEPADFGELVQRLAALEARLLERPSGAGRGAAPAPAAAPPPRTGPGPAPGRPAPATAADVPRPSAPPPAAPPPAVATPAAEAAAPAEPRATRASTPAARRQAPAATRAAVPAPDPFEDALARLGAQRPTMAELLRRGRPRRVDGRLEVTLAHLSDEDRRLFTDPRSMGLFADAVEAAFGARLEVSVGERADDPAPPPPDPFTQEVVDLFGGRIEDERRA